MKKRILAIFSILILIGVITTGVISLRFSRDEYIRELEGSMIDYARMIALEISDESSEALPTLALDFSEAVESRITLIDSSGVVIADSDAPVDGLDNHGTRPEVIEAYGGAVGTAIRYSETLGTDLYYVAYPIDLGGETLVIRISKPMTEIDAFGRRLINNYFLALIAGTLIAMAIGIRFEKYLVKPIQELITMTRRIAEGNFGEKIYTDSDDEIQELSNSFNMMSEELKAKMDELDLINLRLQSTLDSMVNGIIALGNDRRVIFINPQAERMLGITQSECQGKYLVEVFRNHVVYELTEDYFSTQDRPPLEQEIEYGERFYLVNINPIYSSQDGKDRFGALILIQDITEIKRHENMRKEFVANVSHELKTPLTSIRGFVETLRAGAIKDPELRERFLEIIEIESSRLTALIEDTLLLSEIEKGRLMIQQVFGVKQSVEEVAGMMQMRAQQQGITFETEIGIDAAVQLTGNPSWFKQILINLVDNGIKYNRSEGEVRMSVRMIEEYLLMEVSDTGIGIPPAHHERLYERFYRVDHSRSKEQGGTGLGLAIVKHAVLSFGGTIRFETWPGKGTRFIVKIPL